MGVRRWGGVRRCREGLELLVAPSHWASSSTSCSASLFCSSPGERTAGSECLFRNELHLQPTGGGGGGALKWEEPRQHLRPAATGTARLSPIMRRRLHCRNLFTPPTFQAAPGTNSFSSIYSRRTTHAPTTAPSCRHPAQNLVQRHRVSARQTHAESIRRQTGFVRL